MEKILGKILFWKQVDFFFTERERERTCISNDLLPEYEMILLLATKVQGKMRQQQRQMFVDQKKNGENI